jgi:hyperosmotically inducible protein
MNPKTTHKSIVMGGMAAVIAVGVVVFTTGSHPASSVTETAVPPPPIAQAADTAPAAITPVVTSPADVAPLPAAPAASTPKTKIGAGSAVTATASLEPRPAHYRSLAKVDNTAAASKESVAPSVSSEDSSSETVANRVARQTSTDVLVPQLTPSSSAADDAKAGTTGAVLTTSDSQITTDVKTAIASDVTVKDFNIGVSTTDGVVALTGSVASQAAIDQAKQVAGKVKDVKRVDTSALILASL